MIALPTGVFAASFADAMQRHRQSVQPPSDTDSTPLE
jgi:hypothetical protein